MPRSGGNSGVYAAGFAAGAPSEHCSGWCSGECQPDDLGEMFHFMEVAPVRTLDPRGAETLTVGLARNDDETGRGVTSVQLATSASGGPVADWSTSLALSPPAAWPSTSSSVRTRPTTSADPGGWPGNGGGRPAREGARRPPG